MIKSELAAKAAICAGVLLLAACAPAWVPVVGKNPDVQVQSVRSIKSVRVRRIAVMPLVEAPGVAEGAGDSVTAELQAKMALEAGWQMISESDVAEAMQKLPPTTAANLKQNAIALGKAVSADGVLYGNIESYKERVGADYAASSPASVAFTLHLVEVANGQDIWTAGFQKSQKALTDNVFNVVNFLQNSGRWVRAHEIANEGVDAAIEDLHNKLYVKEQYQPFPIAPYEGKFDTP